MAEGVERGKERGEKKRLYKSNIQNINKPNWKERNSQVQNSEVN